ncbi:MAG TPA: hypothetical protein H9738_01870 [Candidatus Blautia pullistercoris]|uniref:Uncharacterized protein n=1 Tax=Candidatus Blautia pullistercoris TaxID=2838499 RepID=A0A9D2ALL7_9FIRM|nr:hypothetical protein [Candidatus Blautia pullistercoris]
MQQIQQQIDTFHTLFYVCLGLCIAFLILSVIFFFKFDIRNIFNTKTGRSVRKTVQSMEEKNARTGSLRRPAGRGYTGTLARSGGIGRTGGLSPSKRLGKVRNVDMNDLIQPPSRPTEALGTEQQSASSMETQVLSPEDLASTLEQIQKEADQSHGMFRIEKYIMLIHTDEVV